MTGLEVVAPGPDAVDSVYGQVHDKSRWNISHRKRRPRSHVGRGQPIHDIKGAAFAETDPTAYNRIWVEALARVFLGLKRDRHSWIATHVFDLVLIWKRGEDEFVSIEGGPGQRDVRLPIGIDRRQVTQRPCRQEIAD